MIFVDTNYFIRFFVADVLEQHKKVVELFESGAKGEVKLFTSTIVFFEIYWVMRTSYKKSKEELIFILNHFLQMSFIEIAEVDTLKKTVDLYENSHIELEDCYNVIYAKGEGMDKFVTFDKKIINTLGK